MSEYFSNILDRLEPRFRMRRRWFFWWDVEKSDLLWDGEGKHKYWWPIRRFRRKEEATAHLVKLQLTGAKVVW